MEASVGLDIGWRYIKAVELTKNLKVTNIGLIEIPRPIKGDEKELIAAKIGELFSAYNFSRDNVVINLRGSHILARTYLPPSAEQGDFERWFVDSIEDLIPGTPIADVVYDYEFLRSGRVIISFARLGAVEDKIKILKACNIIPAAIDASCLALYHAFDKHRWIEEKKTFAILDIGIYSSDLLIVKEGEPFISTEIFFGGKDIKKGKDKNAIFSQDLAINLEKILYYHKSKENLDVERLILVGNYSNIPGLTKNLHHILKIKTEVEDPFLLRKIELPAKFKGETGHHYTQALGLALKGLNSKRGINLMPSEIKEEHKVWKFNTEAKTFFKKNAIISGIILAILLFLFTIVVSANNKISKDVDGLRVKRNELSYIIEEENELIAKINQLKQLSNEPFLWSKMLYNFGIAVPEGLYLTTIATETRLTSEGARPVKRTKVVIEGDAKNSETVLIFLKNLEKHFSDIAIDKMIEEVKCEFKISLTL